MSRILSRAQKNH